MSEPYAGQIILFASDFAPSGWALCDGSLLRIADYPDLFVAIGTTYGGDGESSFALPDLRSRVPIGTGHGPGMPDYTIGQAVGAETVKLTPAQLPQHNHPAMAAQQQGQTNTPAGNVLLAPLSGEAASKYKLAAYAAPGNQVALNPESVGSTGGSQPHANVQPFQAITYCIALKGGGAPLPFLGQILLFPFGYAPRDFAPCRGEVLSISQNTALFSLLGIRFGGDGRATFALPNLKGSVPVASGQGVGLSKYNVGERGGQATVPLSPAQMPAHSHAFTVSDNTGSATDPGGNVLARARHTAQGEEAAAAFYSRPGRGMTTLAPGAIDGAGGDQPHNNMQPYLALNFCISLRGVFPARG
jgi:microcystin-dependent protein